MSKKQLIILSITFLVLLIFSFFILNKNDENWKRGEFANKKELIHALDINKIAKFAIYDKKNRLELSATSGRWEICSHYNYKADFKRICNFMLKISKLSISQNIPLTNNTISSLNLEVPAKKRSNTGTVLNCYNLHGDNLLSLIMGKYHYAKIKNPTPFSKPEKDGRYVMIANSKKPVLVASSLSTANLNSRAWLDKSFVKIKNIKSIKLYNQKNKIMWNLFKTSLTGPYSIKGIKIHQSPNPTKMQPISTTLQRLNFVDVLPLNSNNKITGLDKPFTLVVSTFTGFTYKIISIIKGNKAFARLEIKKDLPTKRRKGKNETSQQTKLLDSQFVEALKILETQYKKEQYFTKWIYELQKINMEILLIPKEDLIIERKYIPEIHG